MNKVKLKNIILNITFITLFIVGLTLIDETPYLTLLLPHGESVVESYSALDLANYISSIIVGMLISLCGLCGIIISFIFYKKSQK